MLRAGALLAAVILFACGCISAGPDQHRLPRYLPDISGRNTDLLPFQHDGMEGEDDTNSVTAGLDGNGVARSRVLQDGDKVVIYLQGIPEPLEISDVIDELGKINLPHIETVNIAGMTTHEAERKIEKAYVEGGYYKKIGISVVILSAVSKKDAFFVGGEVVRPGTYPLTPDLTLSRAIIAAGGFTDFANQKKVHLSRKDGSTKVVNFKEIEPGREEDPAIKSGDMIMVQRGWY